MALIHALLFLQCSWSSGSAQHNEGLQGQKKHRRNILAVRSTESYRRACHRQFFIYYLLVSLFITIIFIINIHANIT